MIPSLKFIEGIKRCEVNAFNCFTEAYKSYEQGDIRQAYFFGILALEEAGKAGFIMDKMSQPQISRKEWGDRESFMSHAAKLTRAREIFRQDILDELQKSFPGLRGIRPALIGWSNEELERLWDYRNKVLFTGYDFDKGEWKSPQDILDLENRTFDVLDKAQSAFLALESQLVEMGIPTELTKIV